MCTGQSAERLDWQVPKTGSPRFEEMTTLSGLALLEPQMPVVSDVYMTRSSLQSGNGCLPKFSSQSLIIEMGIHTFFMMIPSEAAVELEDVVFKSLKTRSI